MMSRIVISGTGLFTPAQSITNEELVNAFNQYVAIFNQQHQMQINTGEMVGLEESSSDFISKASGIKRRHVIERDGILDVKKMKPQVASRSDEQLSLQAEICVIAARKAMQNANKRSADIDAVIVACSNLQRAYPAIAIEVQHALGIQGFAFDMNVACSSATFGLQTAAGLLESNAATCILVINPEICTAHLNFTTRDSHFIFGDACTATVIEHEETASSEQVFLIVDSVLKTEFSNNIRNNAGFINRIEIDNNAHQEKLFKQDGRKVFREVVPLVIELIQNQLTHLQISPAEIKRFWLHQANRHMNDKIVEKLLGHEPTAHAAPAILDEYANTSSAGCMIAFNQYHQDLSSGDIGLLCSFGAGYSIGSLLLRKI